MEQEITIKLIPFEIVSMADIRNNMKAMKSRMRENVLVDWCSLPDILYNEDTREFIGISFLIAQQKKIFVNDMVKLISDSRCKYVPGADKAPQYFGFGGGDRLELYWSTNFNYVSCELASIDTGSWVYGSFGENINGTEVPIAYNLLTIEEIKDGYGLV